MSSLDPWERLQIPSSPNEVSLIRVDGEHPWDLYWGRNAERRLLVARLKGRLPYTGKLPSFKGLRVTVDKAASGFAKSLVLELLDEKSSDFFYLLCQDIVEATRDTATEVELVQEIVSRTWNWHRFLQKGRSGLLTADEQRGLIGELIVLQRLCMPVLGPQVSVSGWSGPLGTARDYEYGSVCLESKAKRAPALPFVDITSEFQLDPHGLNALYLLVTDVTAASQSEGRSLNTIVQELLEILDVDGETLEAFEERLMAAGYSSDHDYSEWQWIVGETRCFSVLNDFPSIRHSCVADGVFSVEYRLSLQQCHRFEVEQDEVEQVLRRFSSGR